MLRGALPTAVNSRQRCLRPEEEPEAPPTLPRLRAHKGNAWGFALHYSRGLTNVWSTITVSSMQTQLTAPFS